MEAPDEVDAKSFITGVASGKAILIHSRLYEVESCSESKIVEYFIASHPF